jgi:Ca2+-binding RTX toxin-like protein
MNGRGDNHVMFGDRGDDKMLGGDGNDGMDASFGDDIVLGENGNELIEGDFGADKISGGNGNDKLWQFRSSNLPDNSKDLITCGDGDDTAFISLADGDLASSDCENIVTSAVT